MMLSADEVAAFWALECSIEAMFVPPDELERAAAEGRIQHASSWSSMGTAETLWTRVSKVPASSIHEYAVVPPGRLAEDWGWNNSLDDRDVDGVLWAPFREDQHAAIARHLPASALDAVLEEGARHLVAFERTRRTDQPVLLDWLVAGDGIDRETMIKELATTYKDAPVHLIRGVRARWIHREVARSLAAVTESYWRLGWGSDRRIRRMEMLRFAARAALAAFDAELRHP